MRAVHPLPALADAESTEHESALTI
jgi:hypothetical protein